MASCIWKALGCVLRLIHTDYAKYYIAGHWKTDPKGLPAWGVTPHTHTRTLEKHCGGWAGSPGPDAYELLKTPSHRLVRSQYCGIVWVKEEVSWRDLEICASPKPGGRPPSAPPLPGKWRGERPLAPPLCSYAYGTRQQNTLPPQDKKVPVPPPQDNFWNSPNANRTLSFFHSSQSGRKSWSESPSWCYEHLRQVDVSAKPLLWVTYTYGPGPLLERTATRQAIRVDLLSRRTAPACSLTRLKCMLAVGSCRDRFKLTAHSYIAIIMIVTLNHLHVCTSSVFTAW